MQDSSLGDVEGGMGGAPLTFYETDDESSSEELVLGMTDVSGGSGLRRRAKSEKEPVTSVGEEAPKKSWWREWREKAPALPDVKLLWPRELVKYFTIDYHVNAFHKWVEKVDEDTGPDSDRARMILKYARLAKVHLKLILAVFVMILALCAFAHYYTYADSKFVAHAKPWHAEYETLYSFSAIANAFDDGRVLIVYETDVGRVTGTFPTVAAPVFEHIESQREHIDALKGKLEKHAKDFCDSKWKPTVVCPQLSGLAAAMLTVCRGDSSLHMYNPVMIEGSKSTTVPQQLETFLPYAHDTVKVRGTMFGVSTRPRYSVVKIRHSSWDGDRENVLEDDEAVSIQTCLDLIRGEVGTLLDPVPLADFLA